jgi:hypothetical protein
VQNTHPGTIALAGDTASGRAYIHELGRARDGRQGLKDDGDHARTALPGTGIPIRAVHSMPSEHQPTDLAVEGFESPRRTP